MAAYESEIFRFLKASIQMLIDLSTYFSNLSPSTNSG